MTIHLLVPPSITLLLEHPTRQLMHPIRLMANDSTLGQIALQTNSHNVIQYIVHRFHTSVGKKVVDVIFGYFVKRYEVCCVKLGKENQIIPTYLRQIYIGLVDSKNSGTRLHGSMMGRSDRTSIMKDIKSLTSSNRIIPLNVMVAWILQ